MSQKKAYLTIDDSPSKDFPQKLAYLVEKDIPTLWFCIGQNLEQYPDEIIRAIQHGHLIGNHSYTHPHFSEITLDEAYDEIKRTHRIIENLYARAGVERPARFFRFPYGDKGGVVGDDYPFSGHDDAADHQHKVALQQYLRELGYTHPAFKGLTYDYYRQAGLLDDVDWYWSYDCMEWTVFKDEPARGIDSLEKVLARMDEDVPLGGCGLNDMQSEEIILLHDHDYTTQFFEPIIDKLLAKGIDFQPIPV